MEEEKKGKWDHGEKVVVVVVEVEEEEDGEGRGVEGGGAEVSSTHISEHTSS